MKNIELWGAEMCSGCQEVFKRMTADGYDVIKYDFEAEMLNMDRDKARAIMASVALSNHVFPVFYHEGAAYTEAEFMARLEEN